MFNFVIPKRWRYLGLIVLLILGTISCEHEVMQKETVQRNGILYLIGDDQPFTGMVVGKGREGYRRTVCTFKKAYQNGLQHGLTVYWYENGKVESKEKYQEGEMHGFVTRYWPNGKPKERIHFDRGQRGGGKGEMYWDRDGQHSGK